MGKSFSDVWWFDPQNEGGATFSWPLLPADDTQVRTFAMDQALETHS